MGPDDSDYYRARAIEERWQAQDAGQASVARIHQELAIQYDALADQLELRPSAAVTAAAAIGRSRWGRA